MKQRVVHNAFERLPEETQEGNKPVILCQFLVAFFKNWDNVSLLPSPREDARTDRCSANLGERHHQLLSAFHCHTGADVVGAARFVWGDRQECAPHSGLRHVQAAERAYVVIGCVRKSAYMRVSEFGRKCLG